MTKIRKYWRQVLLYRKCMNFRFIRFQEGIFRGIVAGEGGLWGRRSQGSACRHPGVTPAILVYQNVGKFRVAAGTPAAGLIARPEGAGGALAAFLVLGVVTGGGIVHVVQGMTIFGFGLFCTCGGYVGGNACQRNCGHTQCSSTQEYPSTLIDIAHW